MSNDKKDLPTYLDEITTKKLTDGFVEQREERVQDSPKGIKIKFYSVTKKNGTKKVQIFKNGSTFTVKTQLKDKKDEKTMTKDELVKFIAGDSDLKFAVDFVKTYKAGKSLERVKSSKKTSKKASKKDSKKTAKKKSSKKSSKKNTKKH